MDSKKTNSWIVALIWAIRLWIISIVIQLIVFGVNNGFPRQELSVEQLKLEHQQPIPTHSFGTVNSPWEGQEKLREQYYLNFNDPNTTRLQLEKTEALTKKVTESLLEHNASTYLLNQPYIR